MKVAVLVSGGVDSSVSLRLLQDQGHDVTAFYLKIWLEDELHHLGDCPWEEDLAYVRAVCEQAKVPLEVVSLQHEYHEAVVTHAVKEVQAGRTPNPDILCNTRIKFGLFVDRIGINYDAIATGHYAQVHEHNGVYSLAQAPDPVKDQSYFLSHLTQKQLSRTLFPIGHLIKAEVRTLAQTYNLPNKERKDSQGICFLGKLKFKDFIAHYCGRRTGKLIELETGALLGNHDGFWFYTIGQRQGIGLGGGPWYVAEKNTQENIVYLSKNYYDPDKCRNSFFIEQCHWITEQPANAHISVKMRHGAHKYSAIITLLDNNRAFIVLDDQDQGIAPGQYAVVYVGTTCLGGGIISNNPEIQHQ